MIKRYWNLVYLDDLTPLDEQRRIVAYLDGLQAKVKVLQELQFADEEELHSFFGRTLMAGILDRAFKGKLSANIDLIPIGGVPGIPNRKVVHMTQLQLDYWDKVLSMLSTIIVIIGAMAGAIKYFQEQQRDRDLRKEELAWRKTQFLLELADDFEKDAQHQVAWNLLAYGTGLPKNSALQKILGNNTSSLSEREMKLRDAIDDYLDFFDRLYHFIFITKALNIVDIEVFGWYIAQIGEIKELHDYATVAGFDDVVTLCKELQHQFGKKHWYKTLHKPPIVRRSFAPKKLDTKAKIEV